MTILVEGELLSLYQKPDFTNKATGEVKEGKHMLQLMIKQELQNSAEKMELYDISIPDNVVNLYKDKVGKTVQIRCKFYTKQNAPIVFYGV